METPRKLITAKLSIRKHQAISTDKDPGLRIESLAVINLVMFPQTKSII